LIASTASTDGSSLLPRLYDDFVEAVDLGRRNSAFEALDGIRAVYDLEYRAVSLRCS